MGCISATAQCSLHKSLRQWVTCHSGANVLQDHFNPYCRAPKRDIPVSERRYSPHALKKYGILKAQLHALLQSSTLRKWAKVIAKAVRKINSAYAHMRLSPYQCLGTVTRDVPLTTSVRKPQPDALKLELKRGQRPLYSELLEASNEERGHLNECRLATSPRLDTSFAREWGMSGQLKWSPLILLESEARCCIWLQRTKANTKGHCNWLLSMVLSHCAQTADNPVGLRACPESTGHIHLD